MVFRSCSRPRPKQDEKRRRLIIELGKKFESHIDSCSVEDCKIFFHDIVKGTVIFLNSVYLLSI